MEDNGNGFFGSNTVPAPASETSGLLRQSLLNVNIDRPPIIISPVNTSIFSKHPAVKTERRRGANNDTHTPDRTTNINVAVSKSYGEGDTNGVVDNNGLFYREIYFDIADGKFKQTLPTNSDNSSLGNLFGIGQQNDQIPITASFQEHTESQGFQELLNSGINQTVNDQINNVSYYASSKNCAGQDSVTDGSGTIPPVTPGRTVVSTVCPCPICSKLFNNSSALAKHKLTHSDERRYQCTICSRSFKRQDHLNGHLLTHSAKKPFSCNVEGCELSYCDARSLRRHLDYHSELGSAAAPYISLSTSSKSSVTNDNSSSSSSSIVSQSVSPTSSLISTGRSQLTQGVSVAEEPNRCDLCGRQFKNLQALNGHMRLHGGYVRKDSTSTTPSDFDHPPPVYPLLSSISTTLTTSAAAAVSTNILKMNPRSIARLVGSKPVVSSSFSSSSGSLTSLQSNILTNSAAVTATAYSYFLTQPSTGINQQQSMKDSYGGNRISLPQAISNPVTSLLANPLAAPSDRVVYASQTVDRRRFSDEGLSSTMSDLIGMLETPTSLSTQTGFSGLSPGACYVRIGNNLLPVRINDSSVPASASVTRPEVDTPSSHLASIGMNKNVMNIGGATNLDNSLNPAKLLVQSEQLSSGQQRFLQHLVQQGQPSQADEQAQHYLQEQQQVQLCSGDSGNNLSTETYVIRQQLPVSTSGERKVMQFSGTLPSASVAKSDHSSILRQHLQASPAVSSSSILLEMLQQWRDADQSARPQNVSQHCSSPVDLNFEQFRNYEAAVEPADHESDCPPVVPSTVKVTNARPQEMGSWNRKEKKTSQQALVVLPKVCKDESLSGTELPQFPQSLQWQQSDGQFLQSLPELNLQKLSGNLTSQQRKRSWTNPDRAETNNRHSASIGGSSVLYKLLKHDTDVKLSSVGNHSAASTDSEGHTSTNSSAFAGELRYMEQEESVAEMGRHLSPPLPTSASSTEFRDPAPVAFTKFKRKNRPEPLIIVSPVVQRFQSQLRSPRITDRFTPQPSFTPYTPPPMLSPVRSAAGLFCNTYSLTPSAAARIGQTNRSSISALPVVPETIVEEDEDEEDEEEDCLVQGTHECKESPVAIEKPPETDVSPSYFKSCMKARCVCVEIANLKGVEKYASHEDLLWDPVSANELSSDDVQSFVDFACCAAVPYNGFNKEYALHVLHLCNGSIKKAVLSLMRNKPSQPARHPLHSYIYQESDRWSSGELEEFQRALVKHGKDFFSVAKQMYYLWKKICADEHKRQRIARRKKEQDSLYNNLRSSAAAAATGTEPAKPSNVATEGDGDDDDEHSQGFDAMDTATLFASDFPDPFLRDLTTYDTSDIDTTSLVDKVSRQSRLDDVGVDFFVDNSAGSLHPYEENYSAADVHCEVVAHTPVDTQMFPCRICGKAFAKVKSRSAHMKSHRQIDK